MQSEDGAAKSVMGKPNCCSSNKQCSNKMAADDNEDGAANSIVGKPDCCSSSKDCSGKAASPTNGNASSTVASRLLNRMKLPLSASQPALLPDVKNIADDVIIAMYHAA